MCRRPPVALFLLCFALIGAAACKEEGGVKVTKFTFEGTNAVEEGQLKSVLATGASSRIPWGTKRYFNREEFEADLKRIVAFYADRGYPNARVTSFDVKLSEDQTSVAITMQIDEGQPVTVERIEWHGFESLPDDHRTTLDTKLPLKKGQPLDRALLQASREAALDELRDHGYPYASVRMAEEPGTSDRQRVVVLRADPGPLAYFGQTAIVGNSSVQDHVVQRQLTFRPGDLFRQSKVIESQRKLYSQELFEFVNIDAVRGEDKPVRIPTRVTLTEGDHRKVNFSVGYGTEEKARAEVEWRHVNFFGGARTAAVRARYSSLDRGLRASLTEPYFFSPRYSITFSGQSWYSDEPAFNLNTNGGRVTITRTFARGGGPVLGARPSMALSLSYANEREDYEISREALEDLTFRPTLISLGLDPRKGTAQGTRSALILDGSRNTTDNLLDAKRGYVASLHLEQAGKWLAGTYDYYELTGEARYYQQVFGNAVIAVQARAGSIDAFGDQDANVPFFKRYFLGGATNLRGWGRFEVSPLSGAGLPIGGATFMNFSAELRAPIWSKLGGVLFLDGGNVWDTPWDFNVNDMRYDVGPGLRFQTPIGPIRADLGYQLNPITALRAKGKEQARRFRFHFSIGQAF
jgi:outer membrane protein insertion porin family/translocation and assembly module TamA